MDNLTGHNIKGYELRERIGAGGFGAVYKAYQSTIGREVAMKIILPGFANHPDFIRRFETEAQLIARLEHLHITPLYDYWRDPNGAYLIMRWLKGGSLREALEQGAFSIEAVALLMDQITSALAAAHRSNVIHRDLKPGNILLDEEGNAYLADFGIAKDLRDARPGTTEPDAVIGSLDYIAPEQARSEPVTSRTDIYSLGVLLYELLVGKHPFPNITPVERLYKHLNEPLPLIDILNSDIGGEVNKVIQQATAKNPAERYGDVLELARALRTALNLGSNGVARLEETMTQREQEILQLISEGHSNKEIAQELFIELATVKWFVTHIYRKLGVRTRVQAMVRARELNLLTQSGETLSSIHIPTADFQPENPYKGLRAFTSADYQDYFGREKLTEKLVKKLGENGDFSHFFSVIGPSGSGKSSLVKAGLIPAIWKGALPNSEKWFVVEMLPSAQPLDELEVALTKVAANHASGIREHLERDERGLSRVASLILPNDGSDLLLVIDQFEEVFTLVENEQVRQHFLNLLHTAVTAPRSRVRVVITMRADFYDRPLHYPEFGEMVRSRMETILPLSAEELERAIAKPAESVGIKFELGLVASIVAEVNYQPGALPLLQYALTELFERRQGRLLTREAYQAIGGTVGALAKRADEIYLSLNEVGQEAARQMFLRLVTLGEGTEDTRRRTPRSELLAIATDTDVMDELIDTYAEYRLLSLDNDPSTRTPTVEVAHEAILREWERLRVWLNESREDVRLQRQLTTMAQEWYHAKQDISFLLRGSRLETFEKWISETQVALTEREHRYLDMSLKQRSTEHNTEAARIAKEYQTARRAQNFQRASWILGIFVILALAAAIIAALSAASAQSVIMAANASLTPIPLTLTAIAGEVQAAELRIVSLGLAAVADDQRLRGNPELAALLGIRALNTAYTAQADNVLVQSVGQLNIHQQFNEHTGSVNSAAFSPDGRTIVTASEDYTARLWDAATGETLRIFSGHTADVRWVVFSPDGRSILTASNDRTARLWDVATGEMLRIFNGHGDTVLEVAFSPDGRTLLTSSNDRTARLWDVATGEMLRIFSGHTGPVYSVIFSPDGRSIVTASNDRTARLWDVTTGETLRTFSGHTGSLYSVVFSPNGRTLLTSSSDQTARLWDVTTGETLRIFSGHTSVIGPVTFSPDGLSVLTGSNDRTARLWDVATGETLRIFTHTSAVNAVKFSPDGRRILTGSADHNVFLWDLMLNAGGQTFTGHTNLVSAVAFSPDGLSILTGSADNNAILWNVATRVEFHLLSGHTSGVIAVAFSPDGLSVLTGSSDQTARLWDVATGETLRTFSGHTSTVNAVAFSPDGLSVLTGSSDQTARLWDVATGETLRIFNGHTSTVNAVAFSPDGLSVLTGSSDQTARLWDVATGEMLRTFSGHTSGVIAVAFSPDGLNVLTGSSDVTARLWDVATGEMLRILRHTSTVTAVAFSPNGRRVLTGSADRMARLWDTDYRDFIAYACTRVFRDFTQLERRQFGIDDTPTCGQFGGWTNTLPPETPIPTAIIPFWTPIALPTTAITLTP